MRRGEGVRAVGEMENQSWIPDGKGRRPGGARPGPARPGQARPGQARPGQARPGQARPGLGPGLGPKNIRNNYKILENISPYKRCQEILF